MENNTTNNTNIQFNYTMINEKHKYNIQPLNEEISDNIFFNKLDKTLCDDIANGRIPIPSELAIRHVPPMTKQWSNGIYSYNKNYVKASPAVDNEVDSIVKSFFTINPLANNKHGIRTKLSIRRFRRLSLNKIFVGDPEIKHNNNAVIITLHIFNKKRYSLLKSLYSKFNTLDLPFKKLKKSLSNIQKLAFKSKLLKLASKKLNKKANEKLITAKTRFYRKKNRKILQNKWISKVRNIQKEKLASITRKPKASFFKGGNRKINNLTSRRKFISYYYRNKPYKRFPLVKSISTRSLKVNLSYRKQNRWNMLIEKFNQPETRKFLLKRFSKGWPLDKQVITKRKMPIKLIYRSRFVKPNMKIFIVKKPIKQKFLNRKRNYGINYIKKRFNLKGIFSKHSFKARKRYLAYKSTFNLANLAFNKSPLFRENNNLNTRSLFKGYTAYNFNEKTSLFIKNHITLINKYVLLNNTLLHENKLNSLHRARSLSSKKNISGHKELRFLQGISLNKKTEPANIRLAFLKSKFSKNMLKLKSVYKLFTMANEYNYIALGFGYNNLEASFLKGWPLDKTNKVNRLTYNNELLQHYEQADRKILSNYSNNIVLNVYKLWKKTLINNLAFDLYKWKQNKLLLFREKDVFTGLASNNDLQMKNFTQSLNTDEMLLNLDSTVNNTSPVTDENKAPLVKDIVLKTSLKNQIEKRKKPILEKTIMYKYSLVLKDNLYKAKLKSNFEKEGKLHPISLEKKEETSLLPSDKYNSMYKKRYNIAKKYNFALKQRGLAFISRPALRNKLGLKARFTQNYKFNAKYKYLSRIRKIFILGHKIDKIQKFCENYIETKQMKGLISKPYKDVIIGYIKATLNKEIRYLAYIKAVLFNNILFRSWFLTPLSNIISRIYNKKVIFNIVNLKYIHLNSDIFLQAIALRLRNSRKNRLSKVLRKALTLVKLSRIEPSANDHNSSVYKYVEQHFNEFKHLNLSIFKQERNRLDITHFNKDEIRERNFSGNDKFVQTKGQTSIGEQPEHSVCIKWLNNAQTANLNLIKFKSVFGLKLQAAGRLTKRSTASRAVFKYKFKGGLKNVPEISRNKSITLIKSNLISNLHYSSIASKTRNGSFGLKTWINNN